ncbi:putative ribonuclease H-like domain-containing protein [Tanacetum coccineum]
MALMAFSDSEVHNDKTCSKTCLKSFETLKTQLDDLRIEFNKSKFNLATYKRGLASVEDQLVFYKKNEVIFCEQLAVLKRDISYRDSEISMLKSELEKLNQEKESNQLKIENFDNASKSLDKLTRSQILDKNRKCVGFRSSNSLSLKAMDLSLVRVLVKKFPVAKMEFVRPKQQEKPVRKPVKYAEMYSFDHMLADSITIKERWLSRNLLYKVNYNYSAKKAHPSAHRNMVPRVVLMKTSLRSLNTARPVNTAHPKTTVYSARPMSHFSKSAQSTVKRPYQIRTTLTNKIFSQKVNTAKGKFYTARPKAVNTARPNSAVVNAVRANHVNVEGLSILKDFDEDMLLCGRSPKEGNFTSKGSLNTVLSPCTLSLCLWKVRVLHKVPDKNNMYRVDMKNMFLKSVNLSWCIKATLCMKSMIWLQEARSLRQGTKTLAKRLTLWHVHGGKHVQVKTGLDLVGFTTWQKSYWYLMGVQEQERQKRIEAIRLFLSYASFKDFVVYQMNVKSAFLFGKIEEEVYVCQPLGFEDSEFPNRVFKVEKALYGLHQAPRAWYETLSTYLLDNGFQRGQIDKTLFIKRVKSNILLVQVYVDDIIFGSSKKELCIEFKKLMNKKFQMSSLASTPTETSKPLMKDENAEDVDVHLYRSIIGSLMCLTSLRPDIMFAVCACARFQVTPKVSHLHAMKRICRYLKGQPKLGLWYPKDSPFDLEAYTDSDYAGASLDKKSTT